MRWDGNETNVRKFVYFVKELSSTVLIRIKGKVAKKFKDGEVYVVSTVLLTWTQIKISVIMVI